MRRSGSKTAVLIGRGCVGWQLWSAHGRLMTRHSDWGYKPEKRIKTVLSPGSGMVKWSEGSSLQKADCFRFTSTLIVFRVDVVDRRDIPR